MGERCEDSLLRPFVEGGKYVQESILIEESDLFFIEHIVYMHPALKLQLDEGGPYPVVGRIFFPDEDQVRRSLVFFQQEMVRLQKARNISILLQVSHEEHIFRINSLL